MITLAFHACKLTLFETQVHPDPPRISILMKHCMYVLDFLYRLNFGAKADRCVSRTFRINRLQARDFTDKVDGHSFQSSQTNY